MNYFLFHIGDYAQHTRHLSLLEDLAYRRILDLCYMTEKPLVNNVKKLSRLIGMQNNEGEVSQVLEDFFCLSESGFTQKRVETEINNYRLKSEIARENGKKGGRPKNQDANLELTGRKAKITQSVNLANLELTGRKANQEPVTSNQEPVTKNQEPDSKEKSKPLSSRPDEQDEPHPDDLKLFISMLEALKLKNPKFRTPNKKAWINVFRLTREQDGRTATEIWNVFWWAHNDSFWSSNILSPEKLRKQYDTLFVKMNQDKGGNGNYQTTRRENTYEIVRRLNQRSAEIEQSEMEFNITPS